MISLGSKEINCQIREDANDTANQVKGLLPMIGKQKSSVDRKVASIFRKPSLILLGERRVIA